MKRKSEVILSVWDVWIDPRLKKMINQNKELRKKLSHSDYLLPWVGVVRRPLRTTEPIFTKFGPAVLLTGIKSDIFYILEN